MAAFAQDRFQNRVRVIEDIAVAEPQYAILLRLKPPRSFVVVLRAQFVRSTVKLDDQLHLRAKEIREVRTDRHLTAELDAVELAVAETLPQDALGGDVLGA